MDTAVRNSEMDVMTVGAGNGNDNGEETREMLRKKIAHVLTIYPCLSQTMLQVGIGNGLPPSIWKPVLQQMIDEGEVVREEMSAESPSGQYRSYTRIRLSEVPAVADQ